MIEKPCNPARQIGRDKLVPRASREPAFEELSRGDRTGRDEDLECRLQLQQPLDQRQHGGSLADARGMDPKKRRLRPGCAGNSLALPKPTRVLLALLAASIQIDNRQWRKRPSRRAI